MLALLALIPNKDKLYIALVLALVSFGTYEYFHLQAEGARDSLITSQSLIAARLRLKSSEHQFSAETIALVAMVCCHPTACA